MLYLYYKVKLSVVIGDPRVSHFMSAQVYHLTIFWTNQLYFDCSHHQSEPDVMPQTVFVW